MASVTICHVTVEIKVDGRTIEQREWPAVDVMKASVTRGWATRQFNKLWKLRKPDQHIGVYWTARHGEDLGYARLVGSLSGVNKMKHKRGIFED